MAARWRPGGGTRGTVARKRRNILYHPQSPTTPEHLAPSWGPGPRVALRTAGLDNKMPMARQQRQANAQYFNRVFSHLTKRAYTSSNTPLTYTSRHRLAAGIANSIRPPWMIRIAVFNWSQVNPTEPDAANTTRSATHSVTLVSNRNAKPKHHCKSKRRHSRARQLAGAKQHKLTV